MATMEAQYINEPTLNIGDIVTLRVNENGELVVALSGTIGDATAANQLTEITKLTNIETNTGTIAGKDFATRSNQNTEIASLASIDGKITAVNTGAVVISSSALPSGAATEVTLSALNAKFPVALVFSNAGANSTLNIKASAGALYSFYCKNINAASRYIQFWNSATDATAGSNLIEFEVPTASTLIIGSDFFLQNGLAFSTGIAFGFSSTSGTYTAATASDMRLLVRYL